MDLFVNEINIGYELVCISLASARPEIIKQAKVHQSVQLRSTMNVISKYRAKISASFLEPVEINSA